MLSGSIHNISNKVDVKEEIKYTRQSLQESHQFMVQAQMQRSYSDVGIWFSIVIFKLCNNHVYANYFLL